MSKRMKIDLYLPLPQAALPRPVAAPRPEAYGNLRRYTAERLPGGCVVIWLGREERGHGG